MTEEQAGDSVNRRTFIESSAMAGGLAAGYGTLGVMAVRFLHASDGDAVGWQFLCRTAELKIGESLPYTTPSGAKVVIARQSDGDKPMTSSPCPAFARIWDVPCIGNRRMIGSFAHVTTEPLIRKATRPKGRPPLPNSN